MPRTHGSQGAATDELPWQDSSVPHTQIWPCLAPHSPGSCHPSRPLCLASQSICSCCNLCTMAPLSAALRAPRPPRDSPEARADLGHPPGTALELGDKICLGSHKQRPFVAHAPPCDTCQLKEDTQGELTGDPKPSCLQHSHYQGGQKTKPVSQTPGSPQSTPRPVRLRRHNQRQVQPAAVYSPASKPSALLACNGVAPLLGTSLPRSTLPAAGSPAVFLAHNKTVSTGLLSWSVCVRTSITAAADGRAGAGPCSQSPRLCRSGLCSLGS